MKAAAWAAIAALAAIVYWPALEAGFVGDDFMILHRLRAIGDAWSAARFFRGEFFEYYRPLGFVSHAVDWLIAGADAWRFHLTNLILHLANTTLVFLIASAPALTGASPTRRLAAGTVAAALFGLDASNSEAVIWIAARFDLLATFFALAGILTMLASPAGDAKPASPKGARERSEREARGGGAPRALSNAVEQFESPKKLLAGFASLAALVFFLALLSKESVVALPIAVAGWAVFVQRATIAEAIRRTAPWLVALAAYAVLRSAAGGVPATGGRLPKLMMFAAVLAGVLALGGGRWIALRDWLLPRRRIVIGACLGITALVTAAAAMGASIAQEKLSVAGFAIFHLLSPVVELSATPYFLDPSTPVYWVAGAAALALLALLAAPFWRHLLERDAALFAVVFLIATLIPISALTEGTRYVYLPSAALSLLAGVLLSDVRARVVWLAAAVVVGISTWQIARRTQDWVWAGRMTAGGAALADASLAPACGGRVVFLTSPVGVRGVYTHFYYETFELPRGCIPDEFHVLARVVRLDTHVDVRWDGPGRIVIEAPDYEGNFVLSRDLRQFDVPLRAVRAVRLETPLGLVEAVAAGARQRIVLTSATGLAPHTRYFYYSDGAIHRLERQP